jgi:hypothetical protein
MGVVYACALSFMSKYLYQSCGPKPMTRVDINDNNQSSNNDFSRNIWIYFLRKKSEVFDKFKEFKDLVEN